MNLERVMAKLTFPLFLNKPLADLDGAIGSGDPYEWKIGSPS
jgi:hypothetical protein